MKDYNNNSNPSLEIFRGHQLTAKETIGTIQNISKNIREYSLRMRETMKTLRESGAIPEMAEAIREGSFAVRDTVKDINEATQDLKKNGVIVDTANAVENTLKSAEKSITTVKEITIEAGKTSPHTAKTVQNGIDMVKKGTSQLTEKLVKDVKNKVGERV
jgi:methyl-accepting chemotaxis protein